MSAKRWFLCVIQHPAGFFEALSGMPHKSSVLKHNGKKSFKIDRIQLSPKKYELDNGFCRVKGSGPWPQCADLKKYRHQSGLLTLWQTIWLSGVTVSYGILSRVTFCHQQCSVSQKSLRRCLCAPRHVWFRKHQGLLVVCIQSIPLTAFKSGCSWVLWAMLLVCGKIYSNCVAGLLRRACSIL